MVIQASILSSKPVAGSIWDDGYANRPAGVSPQYASLLDGYAVRPPWHVAGVDYGVGYASGTSFTNWEDYSHVGCSVDTGNNRIRCDNTNGILFDSVDFTTLDGGYVLLVNCNDAQFINCKFGGTNQADVPVALIQLSGTSGGLTVKYCVLDGGAVTDSQTGTSQSSLITGGDGTFVIQYNWFKNYFQHVVESGNATIDDRFNLIDNGLIALDGHQNYLQLYNGTVNVTWAFNTTKQSSLHGAEGPQFYFNSSGTIHSPVCSNNTMISVLNTGTETMSYMVHGSNVGGTNLTGSPLFQNNYFDPSGAFGAIYPSSLSGWTISGNLNMNTGSPITS